MSALGHKFAPQEAMSALPPNSDIDCIFRHVCFGPDADIPTSIRTDQLVDSELQSPHRHTDYEQSPMVLIAAYDPSGKARHFHFKRCGDLCHVFSGGGAMRCGEPQSPHLRRRRRGATTCACGGSEHPENTNPGQPYSPRLVAGGIRIHRTLRAMIATNCSRAGTLP